MLFFIPLDQRNLGMSMKIERSTVEQVKARFALNKKKMDEKKKEYDLEQRVKELKEEVSNPNLKFIQNNTQNYIHILCLFLHCCLNIIL